MFRTIEDFQTAWAYEAEMTGKVLLGLTDESLGKKLMTKAARSAISVGILLSRLPKCWGKSA